MNPSLALYLEFFLSCGLLGGSCNAAIIYPKAPDGGRQIVKESLRELPRSISRYLGGFQIEDLTIADPFQSYSVGLTNLASGQLLSAAKPGEWRYLLMHGTNAIAAADLITDKTNEKALKFAGLEQTDFSNETLEALRKAERLPQLIKQDYELRRLDCPSILFVAVWLHGKADDIIIPLPATYAKWNAYQPYSESQMIKLLKPEAREKLSRLLNKRGFGEASVFHDTFATFPAQVTPYCFGLVPSVPEFFICPTPSKIIWDVRYANTCRCEGHS